MIARFKSDLLNVINHISAISSEEFLEIIEIIEAYEGNEKNIEYTEDTFSIIVSLDFDKSFTIPVNAGFTNIPTNQTQNIVFTGYPFNEYNGKYLINSVCNILFLK
ncbi:MAG: hypothetical protein IPI60_00315 [Saprospiraceae bacterium]|nr:hypothetical protein [Saprospiraceae bacterium]